MTEPRHIYLIGMRGSGKTVVGLQIARRLALPIADTDALIVARRGLSIADIFAAEGEQAFRDLEARVLAEISQPPPKVIATGGGIVLAEDNIALMRQRGLVFWLDAPPSVLWRRISGDPASAAQRPPLTDAATGEEELARLLAQRAPLYARAAHHRIDTAADSPETIADRIITLCRSAAPP